MANPLKGEAPLAVDGDSYILTFDINALCEVEGLLGFPMAVIERRLGTGDVTAIRALVWAGLHAGQQELTVQEAGVIVQRAGPDVAVKAVRAALSAAFPAAPKGAAKPSPQKAARGTGSSSTAAG